LLVLRGGAARPVGAARLCSWPATGAEPAGPAASLLVSQAASVSAEVSPQPWAGLRPLVLAPLQ
jgi:hypothetical protein